MILSTSVELGPYRMTLSTCTSWMILPLYKMHSFTLLDKLTFIETFAQAVIPDIPCLFLAEELLHELEAVHQQDLGSLLIYAFCNYRRLNIFKHTEHITSIYQN
jgi:hypothetical protein